MFVTRMIGVCYKNDKCLLQERQVFIYWGKPVIKHTEKGLITRR